MPYPDPAILTFYKAYCFRLLSPTYNEWARLTAADVHTLKERPEFEGQQTYFYLNHPIKWIRLVGVVVDFEAYTNRFIMVLDDSSGANIEITCGRTLPTKHDSDTKAHPPSNLPEKARMIGNTTQGNEVDLTGVDIGSVVKAKGGIGCFRGEKQMTLERLSRWMSLSTHSSMFHETCPIIERLRPSVLTDGFTAVVRTTNEEAEAWMQSAVFKRDILSKPWIISEQDEKRARRKAEGHEAKQRSRDEQKKKRRLLKETQKRRERQKERQAERDESGVARREKVLHGHHDREVKPKKEADRKELKGRDTGK